MNLFSRGGLFHSDRKYDKTLSRICLFKVSAFIVLLSCLVSACSGINVRKDLEQIDSLIAVDNLSVASEMLKLYNKSGVNNADMAYYDLLYTKIQYRTYSHITSDSVIGRCVSYYENDGDLSKLCEAYFYKGMIESLLGKHDSAIQSLKKAENIAVKLSDNNLMHKVYNGLGGLNYSTANYTLALAHARKELMCSVNSGNKFWIANAYNHLSCVYDKMGNKDSVYYYIEQVIPFVSLMPDKERAGHLSNIGLYYLHYGDKKKARNFIQESYDIVQMADNAILYSQILYEDGNNRRAFAILDSALKGSDLEGRIKITTKLADIYYKEGDYKNAGMLEIKLRGMKDSLESQRKTSEVQELQLKYDYNELGKTKNRIIRITFYSLTFVVAIVFGFTLYYFYRTKKKGHQNAEIIDKYKNRINELETREKSVNRKVSILKNKLTSTTSVDTEKVKRGHVLYEAVMKGDTVLEWSKEDFGCFIEYYRMLNPALLTEINTKYKKLSHVNKMLLILQDMGFDIERIRHTMCLSSGALRAARFRIKNKENAES